MRKYFIVIILTVCCTLGAQAQQTGFVSTQTDRVITQTGIIPTPQHVTIQDGQYVLNVNQQPVIETQLIASFPIDTNADQAYILEVKADKILIQAITEQGLFYGKQSDLQRLFVAHTTLYGNLFPQSLLQRRMAYKEDSCTLKIVI